MTAVAEPPAVVQSAPESEADFRRWVREEFKHQREMQAHTNAALELILKALKVEDEEVDDA